MATQQPLLMLRHHAYIIQGSQEDCKEIARTLVKQEFCKLAGCMHCITCNQIDNQQFYAMRWFCNDAYNVEDIQDIFDITKLSLQPDEKFIFVIEHAEYLNEYASNKLLKLLEEPPHGYHFLLLTSNAHRILPTIRSRCVIENLYSSKQQVTNQLVQCFTSALLAPAEFLTYITKLDINEHDTRAYLEEIIHFWLALYAQEKTEYKERVISLLQQSFEQLPMSGGSKIFWKNFYLQFNMLSLEEFDYKKE